MRGKLLFVVGIGTGYVLGSRAGRARYEQIKAGADKVWSSQPVQAGVSQVQSFANKQLDSASGRVADGVRKGLGSVLGLNKTPSSASTATARRVRAGQTPVTKTPLSPSAPIASE